MTTTPLSRDSRSSTPVPIHSAKEESVDRMDISDNREPTVVHLFNNLGNLTSSIQASPSPTSRSGTPRAVQVSSCKGRLWNLFLLSFVGGGLAGLGYGIYHLISEDRPTLYCLQGNGTETWCGNGVGEYGDCGFTCYPTEHFSTYCQEGETFTCDGHKPAGEGRYCGTPRCIP